MQDDSAPSGRNVLKQSGTAAYPICIKETTLMKDGFVAVKFRAIAGKEDQAGGIIWRCQDADNYYVARANALEDNVTIYHTIQGRRMAFKNVDTKVTSGEWHTLRVNFAGNRFVVSFDGRQVLEASDDSFGGAGRIGVWTKADSVTLFDDFSYGVSDTTSLTGRAFQLVPGNTFAITFPEMPPTFLAVYAKKEMTAQMTVFLPRNYDSARKHPLLVFLNGGDGGDCANPGVARALSAEKDFVCVIMPLFKATDPRAPDGYVMHDPDGRYMWPFFRTMLDKLETVVPNLDPAHRVLGGFSNGAHAIQGLIDESEGEIPRRFSAFLFVEGGGRLRHYELLSGKLFLMVSSSEKSRPRAMQIYETAKAAGARATHLAVDVGKHDFPVSAYPAVRAWLRETVE